MDYSPKNMPVLSHKAMKVIQDGILSDKKSITVSLDLQLSQTEITIIPEEQSFVLPNGEKIHFPASFDERDNICYFITDQQFFKMETFDVDTNLYYKLVPTSSRPILRVSATQMHKKPFLDYIEHLKFKGIVLDGGTGLGYSAIIAARTADKIITVEWDKNVLQFASYNPYSRELFNSEKIEMVQGDITIEIESYSSDHFDNIIQDGGMPNQSGEFFSQKHADNLFRVLKPRGSLVFYLPRHGIMKGRDFGNEQIRRMKKSGFTVIKRDPDGSYCLFAKE